MFVYDNYPDTKITISKIKRQKK